MQQIDVKALSRLLFSKWKMLLICALAGAILFGCFAKFFMEEKYTSGVSMYVSNLKEAAAARDNDASYSNLIAAEWLVLTYVDVLKDRSTIEKVIPKLSRSVTVSQVANMISMYAIADTAMIRITATADDAAFAAEVCNAMAQVAPEVLNEVVSVGSTKVIGQARPGAKTSPNIPRMATYGAIVGALLMAAYVIIRFLTDNTVKTTAALKENLKVPVLGVVPHFENQPKPREKGDEKHA